MWNGKVKKNTIRNEISKREGKEEAGVWWKQYLLMLAIQPSKSGIKDLTYLDSNGNHLFDLGCHCLYGWDYKNLGLCLPLLLFP